VFSQLGLKDVKRLGWHGICREAVSLTLRLCGERMIFVNIVSCRKGC